MRRASPQTKNWAPSLSIHFQSSAPFSTALKIAYVVVSFELVAIAWVRKRFLHVSMRTSLIQVTLGGIVIAAVGVLLGHA